MKCEFILNVDTEESMLEPSERAKVQHRQTYDRDSGLPRTEAYFASGTILEHPDCWKFVDFGMAKPADDECRERVRPRTDEELRKLQLGCKADSLGIHDKEDRELFFGGVITGYEKVGDQFAYLPGPNWEKHKAELEATKTTDDSGDI